MTDLELLDQFVRGGSQSAFAELVGRHLDWVCGVARRAVGGDAHLAEDVTQATFIVLARKAATIAHGTVLTAWLFRVARYTAAAARRAEGRRRRHEARFAATMSDRSTDAPGADWQQVAPVLDEMVARLPRDDRRAVLLRFYRRKSFRAVGEALGVSEEAARKRVGRAVDRLRARLNRRTGAGAMRAVALVGVLLEHVTAPAPAALASSAASESLSAALGLAAAHAAAAGPLALAKGAMHMMAWAQTKLAAATVAAVVVLGGTGAWVSTRVLADRPAQSQAAPAPAPAPAGAATKPATRPTTAPAAALDRKLPQVNFRAVPLGDVVAFLHDVTGARIEVDWAGLQPLGVSKDAAIDLSAKDATFEQVLRRAFAAAGAKDPVRVRAAVGPTPKVTVDALPRDEKGKPAPAAGGVLDHPLPGVNFRQVAFADALDFFKDMTGREVIVDWPALAPLGVSRDAKVDLRVQNATFESALRAAFTAAGATRPVRIGLAADGKVVVDAPK